jgi:hypothetical protein
LPRVLGPLGLYATYVAAALLLLAIVGDLAVLTRRPPLVGWLALLVGTSPLVALLLTTLASYVNYYGVWRTLRGQDVFDAGADLKSHAADLPQAAQSLLAGRAGCLPVVSALLLVLSLLLVVPTALPPTTPVLGSLGAWSGRVGSLALGGAPAPPARPNRPISAPVPATLPTPTATLTAVPTATATALPTATSLPLPTATPTPVPTVIQFTISPTTASWNCPTQGMTPPAVTITLDNTGSNVAVSWSATVVDKISSGAPWATVSPAGGTVPAGGQRLVTISPYPSNPSLVCYSSGRTGTPYRVTISATGAGTSTFTETVVY